MPKAAALTLAVAALFAIGFYLPIADGQQPPAPNAPAADSPSLLLIDLPPGQHFLRVSVGSGGLASAEVIKPLRIGDVRPGPTPGKFSAKVQTWLATVNVSTAEKSKVVEGLATAYRAIAGQINAGKIQTTAQAASAAKQARQLVYETLARRADAWASFDESLAGEFKGLMAAGELADVASVGAAFSELADGLSANSTSALSPEIIQLIIRLVLQIIERLLGS